jgi:hypothetical protein
MKGKKHFNGDCSATYTHCERCDLICLDLPKVL